MEAIADAEKPAIAGASLYELAWLIQRGRIEIAVTPKRFLGQIARRFTVLPITAEVAGLAAGLPPDYPSDPMDRLIGATALAHGVPLVTRDRAIRGSGAVPVIW